MQTASKKNTPLFALLSALVLLAFLLASVSPALAKSSITVQVPATTKWFNSRIQVKAGNQITIVASGNASTLKTSKTSQSGPAGQKVLCGSVKTAPPPCALNYAKYGALVGKIGYGTPFLIGKKLTFTASTSGTLYLSVNDNLKYYADNKGGYKVTVTTP
jgi:hypothetical protein